MVFQINIVSHEDYFSRFIEEKSHYFSYTKPWDSAPNYKVILHGFIKWDDEDACIWGGPFPGNYCLMQLMKYKSPLLPNIKTLQEDRERHNLKYKWVEKIPYENYTASKEKPYKVYLMGNDDASYSKVFGTKTHALRSIESLCIYPNNNNLLKIEKFVFTN